MTDLSNSREAKDNAATAAEGKSPDTREEHASPAPKERKYLRIEPPEVWARTPVVGPRG